MNVPFYSSNSKLPSVTVWSTLELATHMTMWFTRFARVNSTFMLRIVSYKLRHDSVCHDLFGLFKFGSSPTNNAHLQFRLKAHYTLSWQHMSSPRQFRSKQKAYFESLTTSNVVTQFSRWPKACQLPLRWLNAQGKITLPSLGHDTTCHDQVSLQNCTIPSFLFVVTSSIVVSLKPKASRDSSRHYLSWAPSKLTHCLLSFKNSKVLPSFSSRHQLLWPFVLFIRAQGSSKGSTT